MAWSGNNTASARETAASEISATVQNIQSTSRNEKIFIIGHSHGGSAIAYFLKEHPSLAKTLNGCAFLSTPFVAIRPRPQAFRVVYSVLYFPWIAFIVFYPIIIGYALGLPFGPRILVWLCPDGQLWVGLFFLRKFRNAQKLLDEAHGGRPA